MNSPFRSAGPRPSSFLPEDYINRKSEARANILVLSVFTIVMAAVVGAFLVTFQQKVTLRKHLVTVTEQYNTEAAKIEQLKQLEAQRAQIMEKAQLTAALVERLPRWAVYQEITLRMSDSMRLNESKIKSTRIDPPAAPPPGAKPPAVKSLTDRVVGAKKEELVAVPILAPRFTYQLTIIGGAKENNDIADFISSLKQSPILDDVELAYIRDSKGSDELLPRKFEISATLRSDVDSAEVAASLRGLIEKRTTALGLKKKHKEEAALAKEESEKEAKAKEILAKQNKANQDKSNQDKSNQVKSKVAGTKDTGTKDAGSKGTGLNGTGSNETVADAASSKENNP